MIYLTIILFLTRLILYRKGLHTRTQERDRRTNQRTGNITTSQNHLTVYLGTTSDQIEVHGHIYAKRKQLPTGAGSWRVPAPEREGKYELMPVWERRDGGRNPELWLWHPVSLNLERQYHRDDILGLQSWTSEF